ncbi:hypothetical protein HERIO_935 [Hepatospora eriocheir]|uniref:Uncharacterized protein n=1 Tax=Hepatospora eriocheir TaxID=1081669 RepID=A0A1X0QBP2_9MICR|nr:hypothetical protein HERIO_935 [Hepatospora eriocheir]
MKKGFNYWKVPAERINLNDINPYSKEYYRGCDESILTSNSDAILCYKETCEDFNIERFKKLNFTKEQIDISLGSSLKFSPR